MAIANLHETWLTYKQRSNTLSLEISELQSQRTLALSNQADLNSLSAAEQREIREQFKDLAVKQANGKYLYEGQEYINYTEIPDFEDAIDKIVSEYNDKLAELAAWESAITAQITTKDAENSECKAYMESIKTMLSSNIQEDFNFGLNK